MEGLILPLILMVGCGILTIVLLEIHYSLTREQYTPFEWRERYLLEWAAWSSSNNSKFYYSFIMNEIKEMMNGTALLLPEIGIAKKAGKGIGWTVHSLIGNVYPSKRFGVHPGEMSSIKCVSNKNAARNALIELFSIHLRNL